MKELADELDAETEALLDRWRGQPERIAEDIFRVRDLETGDIRDLELFRPYQVQFLRAFFYGDADTINVFKGRRIGLSFVACVAILIDAMQSPHAFYAITAPSKSQAKDRIEDIYDLIELAKIDFDLEVDNRDEIQLSNGATIMGFSGSPDTSRGGDAAKAVLVDEMAFLEDQDATMRAFNAFTALGDSTMIQISTPNASGDRFLETHESGSPAGKNGIISIKQPTFASADDIDPTKSLLEQDVTPVRDDLNVEQVEKERMRDPRGFEQEYLCQPASDEYRFFDPDSIERAQNRGERPDYAWGPHTQAQYRGQMVMGVDIGISSDDTAIAVFEHAGENRYLRYHEIVTDQTLRDAGIRNPDRSNTGDIAIRIRQLVEQMGVDQVFYDETGPGQGFISDIQQEVGRMAQGFNFTDKAAVESMMKDLNYALHNDQIDLVDDTTMADQLEAIVVKRKEDWQKPKFTGKKHAPEGKDDLAVATALAAFPPALSGATGGDKTIQKRTNVSTSTSTNTESGGRSGFVGVKHRRAGSGTSPIDREYRARRRETTRRTRRRRL